MSNKRTREKDTLVADFCDPALDTGQSIRIPECSECEGEGNQNGVQITRVADGFTWWCYRCTRGGKVYDIGMSPEDTLKRLRHMRNLVAKKYSKTLELPEDFTTEIPQDFVTWLSGYELEPKDWEYHEMGYSPSYDRLIIPVYISGLYGDSTATGKMIAWTGRSTESLFKPTKDKWYLLRQWGIKYVYHALLQHRTDILILVEDMISCIKLWTAGYNAVALLTTYVPNELLLGLRNYDVRLWLDPDAVGKSMNFTSRFQSYGVPASWLHYHKDPKDCPYKEIPNVVEGD